MDKRILVVEDESDLAELVAFNLRQASHEVQVAVRAGQAVQELQRLDYDLVVLDLMLPDMSGIELCRRLRRDPRTERLPILMLTASGEEVDRVVGFEVGADDYMVKPFSPRELVLRVAALLRRSTPVGNGEAASPANGAPSYRIGTLEIDTSRHKVTVSEEEVALTALEFRLILHLARRLGHVQSREALLGQVWGYSPGTDTRTVDTHVKRLREKLLGASDLIETVRGVGYRLREPSP